MDTRKLVLIFLALVLCLSGCGGNNPTPPSNSAPPPPSLVEAPAGNTIALENTQPGDSSWVITKGAVLHNLEGFASASSVTRGDSIKLFVNTVYPTYTIDIFRMGWYGGAGARRMVPTITRTGTVQTLPIPDPVTGLAEANWTDPYELTIPGDSNPNNWCSGVYLAKLTAGKEQSYILFVVRDDARHSNYVFQIADSTYQAYNTWLGKSLYGAINPDGIAARVVSYNRPLFRYGTGLFFHWEYPMIRWMEKEGYDVQYISSIDTHARGSLLMNHEAFLSVGHDEYWSWQMRDNVERARDSGKNIAFFSSNVSYWQVRFEPSKIDGTPNRVMIGYKEVAAAQDPYALDGDPTNDKYITGLFVQEGRPEEAMVGVHYTSMSTITNDMVIKEPQSFAFANLSVAAGDNIPGIVSGEVDKISSYSPANIQVIAHSPVVATNGSTQYADTTVYSASSGAVVFAAGSFTTSWGVDDYYFPLLGARPAVSSDRARVFVTNILSRMRQHY